jgi:hypothetical protein
MGKLYLEYCEGDNLYVCVCCRAHLSSYNQIISKVKSLFTLKKKNILRHLEAEGERLFFSIQCKLLEQTF